jgi:hypothetical protein
MIFYSTRHVINAIDKLRQELHEAFQQQIGAIRNASETAHQDHKDISARIDGLRVREKEKADNRAYREKQYRLQKWLNRGTWFAFIAAAIYAAIAAFQLSSMKESNRIRPRVFAGCAKRIRVRGCGTTRL